VVQHPRPKDFKTTIKQQNSSLDIALSGLIRIIDNRIPDNSNCDQLKELGIECLFDKSNWENIFTLSRPVIMEFPISTTENVYGLLVGLHDNDPIFQFDNKEMSFPIDQVLTSWNGRYLLLWQPPIKNIKFIYPYRSSKAVLWLREKLSIYTKPLAEPNQAYFFDDELKMAVVKFQKQHKLSVDGIVGFKTFIQLQNNDSQNNHPKLRKNN